MLSIYDRKTYLRTDTVNYRKCFAAKKSAEKRAENPGNVYDLCRMLCKSMNMEILFMIALLSLEHYKITHLNDKSLSRHEVKACIELAYNLSLI